MLFFRILIALTLYASTAAVAQMAASQPERDSQGASSIEQQKSLTAAGGQNKKTVANGAAVQTTAPVTQGGQGNLTNEPKPAQQFSPNTACVSSTTDDDFGRELRNNTHPMGEAIVTNTRFLPTGQRVDIGIRRNYAEGLRYFGAYETPGGYRRIFDKSEILTRKAIPSDSLVKAKLLNADETIVTLDLDEDDAGGWRNTTLYVYTCFGSPNRVSQINVVLSPYKLSLLITGLCVVVAYIMLSIWLTNGQTKAFNAANDSAIAAGNVTKRTNSFQTYFANLNPPRISVGLDSRASLSKLQVLGFSLLVFALLLLLLLQTGVLSDLNATILGLLGINGLGAALAKGADGTRNALTPENQTWLVQHRWLPAAAPVIDPTRASWHDFFTTDGEFDVYRFQSFIFSIVIGISMILAGVGQLSTFSVPDTILGIVGLSQAVYIGGKLVTPTTMKTLNDAIDDLRAREKKLRVAAVATSGNITVLTLALLQQHGGNLYAEYLARAHEVCVFYTSQTNQVVQPSDLEPRP